MLYDDVQKYISSSFWIALWGSCQALLPSGGVALGVLVGGAVGAKNPRLAEIYFQFTTVCCLLLMTFWWMSGLLSNAQEELLSASTTEIELSEEDSSTMATYTTSRRVFFFAIPGVVGVAQLSHFFAAQRIVYPEAASTALGLVLVLFLNSQPNVLSSLDGIFQQLGVSASSSGPIITVVIIYAILFTMIPLYLRAQKKNNGVARIGWGMSSLEMSWERITTFAQLYIPAALCILSDNWNLNFLDNIANKIGETEAHSLASTHL